GSVAMDMITVDIGDNRDNIKVGDEVIMWGPELPVEEIAQCATTIPYELLCNITPRVSYEYQE
ncbi:MAG: alanine racemase C-terminal domain-containing protein, partial [Pseudomonadota bacterium]|nr:alanine racemase C-terminal domain-containing protein [Pseudomonadota bacterium]